MNSRRALLVVTALLMMAALPVLADNGGCVAIVATSPQVANGVPATTFSANGIIDIDLWVLFDPGTATRLSGDHQVEVKIFTPRHFLYESKAIPFTSESRGKGTQKKLDGYPLPMPERVLQKVSWGRVNQLGTSVRLPVAGTLITANSLYGVWTAEAYVDRAILKCATAAKFEIVP